ncbi:MAG: hypothetical protein JNG86_19750, partial [Verrucomicrobiaceae bacterium]|nr:hypothetical protein [Verrucomicrobiaceae bacterium]
MRLKSLHIPRTGPASPGNSLVPILIIVAALGLSTAIFFLFTRKKMLADAPPADASAPAATASLPADAKSAPAAPGDAKSSPSSPGAPVVAAAPGAPAAPPMA